jgi:hypothetical protein
MLHLDPERLAALADDEPTLEEAAHLAMCEACACEREAHLKLRALAAHAGFTPFAEPLTDWSTISERLSAEGVVRSAGGRPAPVRRMRWLQVAAALFFAVGGAAVGRATASHPLTFGDGGVEPSLGAGVRHVSAAASDSVQPILSVTDALLLMSRAESDYRIAAAYVAAHDTVGHGYDGVRRIRTRLAALDRCSDATLAGVNESPSDPVLNQYLISMLAARAFELQQLNSSLPSGITLTSY